MAEIRFTSYALEQLRERGLTGSQVREAVVHADQIVEAGRARKIAQKRIKKIQQEYLLRIVYEEHAGEIVVITAYTTSKIAKYWRRE